MTKPAVLSYGRIAVDGNWLCSGTVPSDAVPFGLASRKIRKPLTAPDVRTSAHPVSVGEVWGASESISSVALGLITRSKDDAVTTWEARCWLTVRGSAKAVPSSA